MSRIKCPHCDHKPFRSENGLKWHLEHIHQKGEHKAEANSKPRLFEARDIITIKNKPPSAHVHEVEEKINSRLDIHLKRQAWLSERISALEQTIQNWRDT